MVQTIVRSDRFPDPVNLVWEHRGVRSIGSDHSSIWVLTKTWVTQNAVAKIHMLDYSIVHGIWEQFWEQFSF